MKQGLEKYLKEKRFQLDVEQPDEMSVWEGIKTGMGRRQQMIPPWFWKAAAILLLLISTTYIVVNETSKSNNLPDSLTDVSEELGKQAAEFEQVAQQKWDEAKPYLSENREDFKFLLEELDELETIYATYSEELSIEGANEFIIRALLDYHEKKIKTLDRLLLEIQKQQNHEEQITL